LRDLFLLTGASPPFQYVVVGRTGQRIQHTLFVLLFFGKIANISENFTTRQKNLQKQSHQSWKERNQPRKKQTVDNSTKI